MKFNEKEPRQGVEITAQGHLLTVKPFRQLGLFSKNHDRGTIAGFSRRSRKRLLELIAKLENVDRPGYRCKVSFLTLTTKQKHHPTSFKPLLFTWFKRLRRKFDIMSAIWRIEPQKRGATHAHIILYNAPFIDKGWIQKSWGEVIEEPKPFTRIEKVKSHRKIMSYASKYIAKPSSGFNNVPYLTDESTGEILSPGRSWGVYQRDLLPFCEATTINVPLDGSWFMLRRYCQRLYFDLELNNMDGFTIFCDEPEKHLLRLQSTAVQFSQAQICPF